MFHFSAIHLSFNNYLYLHIENYIILFADIIATQFTTSRQHKNCAPLYVIAMETVEKNIEAYLYIYVNIVRYLIPYSYEKVQLFVKIQKSGHHIPYKMFCVDKRSNAFINNACWKTFVEIC
jgi:hypothetical protein